MHIPSGSIAERKVNESLLHFIWKTQYFKSTHLVTTDGQSVCIYIKGRHNSDAGPDFLETKIQIGNTIWCGHVEIHVRASDWDRHGHNNDPAYKNVILHVVWEDDQDSRPSHLKIPVLQLKDMVDHDILDRMERLEHSTKWVPCESDISKASALVRRAWLDRLAIHRLSTKTAVVHSLVEDSKGDLEWAFFSLLSMYYGMRVNRHAFLTLVQAIPYRIIRQQRYDRHLIEALLFGMAGHLSGKPGDTYQGLLKATFNYQCKKFNLQPIYANWKFMRMRPVNFPTVRLAQLSALVHSLPNLMSAFMEASTIDDLHHLLNVESAPYWHDHYRFGVPAKKKYNCKPGRRFAEHIAINVMAPFMYFYGHYIGDDRYCKRSVKLLESTPAEQNSIIRKWQQCGIEPRGAMDSQALIELKETYCDYKKCLECQIGCAILFGPQSKHIDATQLG